jgi:hypothetical protein
LASLTAQLGPELSSLLYGNFELIGLGNHVARSSGWHGKSVTLSYLVQHLQDALRKSFYAIYGLRMDSVFA